MDVVWFNRTEGKSYLNIFIHNISGIEVSWFSGFPSNKDPDHCNRSILQNNVIL